VQQAPVSVSGAIGLPGTAPVVVGALRSQTYAQPFAIEAMRNLTILEALIAGEEIDGLPSSPFLGTQVVGGQYYQSYFQAVSRFSQAMTDSTIQVSDLFNYYNNYYYCCCYYNNYSYYCCCCYYYYYYDDADYLYY